MPFYTIAVIRGHCQIITYLPNFSFQMHMVYFHVLLATFMKSSHHFEGVLSVQYALLHNCRHTRALPNNHIPTQFLIPNAYGVLSRSLGHIHEVLASFRRSPLGPICPSTQLPSYEGIAK